MNKITLIKLTNNITYRRYENCLKRLQNNQDKLPSSLIGEELTFSSYIERDLTLDYYNKKLNEGQQNAVRLSLSRSDVTLIHGPPGTGKTTTLVELISQHVRLGEKVLVCAPSNIAVDNLLLKLAENCKVVRVGHPARVNVALQQYSLDAQLKVLDEDNIIGDVRKDMDSICGKFKGLKDKSVKYSLRSNLGELRKELKTRESAATRNVLANAQVVLATLTSSSKEGPIGKLPKDHFSLCVIDEVSQALEVACWIAIQNAKKVVLAGDHLQLPPTIKSTQAAKEGLDVTLLERLMSAVPKSNNIVAKLTEQYRMNTKIMTWSSDELYNGELTAHPSVAAHILSDIASVESTDVTAAPLMFIDTSGVDLRECLVGVSKGNEGEARIVVEHIKELLECGMEMKDIAVITPYNLQIELIREVMGGLYKPIEVCSVDGFQGREKECIIISMVRSNKEGEIGFLSERRRMNVAVTRARRHVCVIGDSRTVSRDKFLGRLVKYLQENGLVKSAFEYDVIPEDVTVHKSHDAESDKDEPATLTESKRTYVPDKVLKEVYEEQLSTFQASNEAELEMGGLTSYQRRLVHLLCEDKGLYSESRGSGPQRKMVISKVKPEPPVQVPAVNDDVPVVTQTVVEGKEGEEDTLTKLVVCKTCAKRIPELNYELHLIRCKDKVFLPPPKEAKVKPVKKKKEKAKPQPTPVPDELDILDQALRDKYNCCNDGCSAKALSYMGSCQFCSRFFCTAHKFPESHGCGSRARSAACAPSASNVNDTTRERLKNAMKEKTKEKSRKSKKK